MVAVARERLARQRPPAEGGAEPIRRLQVVDEEWLRRRASEERRARALRSSTLSPRTARPAGAFDRGALPGGARAGAAFDREARPGGAFDRGARPGGARAGARRRTGGRPSAAVVRRRRLVAALAMVALSSSVAFGARALAGGSPESPSSTAQSGQRTERVWIVRPGDTVWSLVEASGVHGDIRPVVDRIEASLHNQPLQVGERVVVPVAR